MSTIPGEINELQDGEKIFFGDNHNFSIRKDGNYLVLRDELNDNDISVAESGGDYLISNGERVATRTWVNNNSSTLDPGHTNPTYDPDEDGTIQHGDLGGVGSNDHHSRPQSTQEASMTEGYSTFGINPSDGNTSTSITNTIFSQGTWTFTLDANGLYCDGLRFALTREGLSVDLDNIVVVKGNGNETLNPSSAFGGGYIYSNHSSGEVIEYRFNFSNSNINNNYNVSVLEVQPHSVSVPPHAHGI